MASNYNHATLSLILFLSLHLTIFTTTPSTAALVKQQPLVLKYHNGLLLKGQITLNLIWYGNFTPSQRSIIVDFIQSLRSSSRAPPPHPSVASWWQITDNYKGGPCTLTVGNQLLLQNYPLGKTLKNSHIIGLGSRPNTGPRSINVILTAHDVAVEGFCMRCGSHGFSGRAGPGSRVAYLWIGNSVTQCPGQCAWPFQRPIYGPQTPAMVAPNGDVGVDGMVINLATLLAGTVTNPFSGGYFQGPVNAPLEAVSACTGVFGSGAYPGYPGRVLVEKLTGASYNANGVNGRKFLLPAMWDPRSSACSTLGSTDTSFILPFPCPTRVRH